MNFDWDAGKAAANRRKHGVSFEEASEVFGSALAVTIEDARHSQTEDRAKTIGPSQRGRILVVIHVRVSLDAVRIISARKAGKQEVGDYEEEIRQRLEG